MDNPSYKRDGEVFLKRYTHSTGFDGVQSTVVNEIANGKLVNEDDKIKDLDKEGQRDEQAELSTDGTGGQTEIRLTRGKTDIEKDKLLVKDDEEQIRKYSISTQKDFDELFTVGKQDSPTLKDTICKKLSKCHCSQPCLKRKLYTIFPCINILKNYNIRQDFMGDIVAGLTVGIMHIPQGMAYAMLATLSPVYGLYTSFFPVLVYFFFGSSKHVSLGTASVVCLMIGSAVTKGIDSLSESGLVTVTTENPVVNQSVTLSENQTDTTTTPATASISDMTSVELELRLQFAMSVTFMVGIIQLLMAALRLGFITDFMSDALISGFTTGVACHVFTSQITNIFSIKLPRYSGVFKLVYVYRDFFSNIGSTNYFTVVLSVISAVLLYCTSRFINQNPKLRRKMFMPVPIELIVVVLGTVFSYVFDLEENFKVAVVSDIPTGLPVPNTKGFSRISWTIVQDAFPIVIVIFSISISIAKLLAKKNNYEVDANQELLAFGVSSIVCSFLSSVAPMAALSRAVVQERVGGKTQVAGLVSCCLLLVVLLVLGQYFKTTPKCVLAAVIVVALRGMLCQILDLKNIYDMSKINFFVWIVAFVATLLLDVDLGLGVAVAFNVLVLIYRIQRPHACLLGKLKGTDLYRDIKVHPQAREVPGIKIFRYEQSLFFLNKEHFRTLISKYTVSPTKLKAKQARNQEVLEKEPEVPSTFPSDSEPVKRKEPKGENNLQNKRLVSLVKPKEKKTQRHPGESDFHTIILDCSPWSFIDTMGVYCLSTVIDEYKEAGIKVVLADCRDGVQEMFKKTKFYDTLDQSDIYVSIQDAVSAKLHSGLSGYQKQENETVTAKL